MHHGGEWVVQGDMVYSGGRVDVFDYIHENADGKYVKELVDSLGYNDIEKVHFWDPRKEFKNGVRFLGFDSSTCDPFLALLFEYKSIHIYIEHKIKPTYNFNLNRSAGGGGGRGSFLELLNTDVVDLNSDYVEPPFTVLPPKQTEPQPEPQPEPQIQPQNVPQPEIDYDSEGTDEDDDELATARSKISDDMRREKAYFEELVMLKKLAESKVEGGLNLGDDFDGYSDLDSPSESEDEDDVGYLVAPQHHKRGRGKQKQNNTETEEREATFYVGQQFENPKTFRKAIIDYSIDKGRNIPFSKNDSTRVCAECEHKDKGCKWRIWASWERGRRSFTVKTFVSEHTCGRTPIIKKMTSHWIAEHYQNLFKVNPYMRVQDIQETIWLEKGIRVSKDKAARARRRGQALIVGEYKEQYALLPRYAAEILRSNPGNTVKLKLDANVFDRLYLCFEALRKGFLAGCRPFISLDGCFLKGPFGGQLLVAVGRDGNNQMFPLAWAVCEVESTDTWSWFLELLATDLGTSEGAGYTFMSDQQKGLLAAVSNVFPQAESRVCARHVYCNFRGVFGGGLEYRKQFWTIAKSNTVNHFNENIEVMRGISHEAAEDLLKRNYKKWCRAFYTPLSCCDSVDNNMSEVFNAYILSARHKPIITMLEDIREGLMERLHKKRDFIGKKEIMLCPRIQIQLEKHKIWARGWNAYWDGGFCYGVREGATQVKYVVDLNQHTCSCNAWQVSGIPCKHAIVAIWNKVDHPEQYVNAYFCKQTYMKAYEFLLEPLNGPQEWPTSDSIVVAPKVKKVNGRPKTKRRYGVGEVTASGKLKRTGCSMKCSLCGVIGHNKRGCKNAPKQQQHSNNHATAEQTTPQQQHPRTSSAIPMHNRGVGIYTYPNGYQRIATVSHSIDSNSFLHVTLLY